MNLEDLIQRFQSKDPKAFETLHGMYAENILGAVNLIVQDRDLAEEVTQDVFLKIWHQSDSYDASKGRFFTWLLRIARNAAIDAWRSKDYQRSKKNLPADFFVGTLKASEDTDRISDLIGLRNLLQGLKDTCLELIEMLYFKGYTQKEVSEELDIPIGTIKTRNRNCIGEIRKNQGI